MKAYVYRVISLFVFVASMLALFTGLLSMFPDPMFPADHVVGLSREFCFWLLGTDQDIVPYFGNMLAVFLMFTLTALLGDLVDLIADKREFAIDGKSLEYLMRFLYRE